MVITKRGIIKRDLEQFYKEDGKPKHVVKLCQVRECNQEASYWTDGNDEMLCGDHACSLAEKLSGLDGEDNWDTIGEYSCSPECFICNN